MVVSTDIPIYQVISVSWLFPLRDRTVEPITDHQRDEFTEHHKCDNRTISPNP